MAAEHRRSPLALLKVTGNNIVLYAIWLLVQTFTYLSVSYLERPTEGLSTAVNWLRVATSFGLIFVVPHLIVQVSGLKPVKLVKILLYLPAAATLIALVCGVRTRTNVILTVTNFTFNEAIGGLMVLGVVRVWKRKSTVPRHEVLPFLLLSSILYLLLLSIGVLLAVCPDFPAGSVIANGAPAWSACPGGCCSSRWGCSATVPQPG